MAILFGLGTVIFYWLLVHHSNDWERTFNEPYPLDMRILHWIPIGFFGFLTVGNVLMVML